MLQRRRPVAEHESVVPEEQHHEPSSVSVHVSHHLSAHPPEQQQQQQQDMMQQKQQKSWWHALTLFRLVSPLALCLLCSGCSLALLSQHMANLGISMPQAQIPAWTKYTANFLLSYLMESVMQTGSNSSKDSSQPNTAVQLTNAQAIVMAAMGLLDVVGYGLSCIAFTKCGAALTMVVAAASGQICTALTRLLLLRKPLTGRQCIAVAVVTSGLVLRGMGGVRTSASGLMVDHRTVSGVLLILLSALSYSLLGVGYEWLMQVAPGKTPSQALINGRMSVVGAAMVSVYQAVYTWPRRQELVIQPLQEAGVAVWYMVLMYACFGGIFTTHSHLQGQVLGLHGAMSVGIINAMRAMVVSVSSAALFCRPGSTSQCLTLVSGTSAVLVTTGALLWATSPPAGKGRNQKQLRTLPSYSNLQAVLPNQLESNGLRDVKQD